MSEAQNLDVEMNGEISYESGMKLTAKLTNSFPSPLTLHLFPIVCIMHKFLIFHFKCSVIFCTELYIPCIRCQSVTRNPSLKSVKKLARLTDLKCPWE